MTSAEGEITRRSMTPAIACARGAGPRRHADHLRVRRPGALRRSSRPAARSAGSTTPAACRRAIDAAGRRTELTFDDDDRVVAIKRPGGGVERFEYDAEGGRTAVILPGGQRHELGRDARGAISGYTPAGGATSGASVTTTASSSPRASTATGRRYGYQPPLGRSTGATWADAVVDYGYDGSLNRPTSIKRTPAGGGTAERQAFTFDGAQTTGLPAAAARRRVHLRLRQRPLPDLVEARQRRPDGEHGAHARQGRALTTYGPFTIARGGAAAWPARSPAAGCTRPRLGRPRPADDPHADRERDPALPVEVERSDDGRITRQTETVSGRRTPTTTATTPTGSSRGRARRARPRPP